MLFFFVLILHNYSWADYTPGIDFRPAKPEKAVKSLNIPSAACPKRVNGVYYCQFNRIGDYMPRPRKPRRCGCDLCCLTFRPAGVPLNCAEQISLAADELETLRLCDLEGLTQQDAGECMGVSRGTVQRTVKQARAKVAKALVEGAALVMEGADIKAATDLDEPAALTTGARHCLRRKC
jgi:predicted DNA-binding protein (UPF0251 family)